MSSNPFPDPQNDLFAQAVESSVVSSTQLMQSDPFADIFSPESTIQPKVPIWTLQTEKEQQDSRKHVGRLESKLNRLQAQSQTREEQYPTIDDHDSAFEDSTAEIAVPEEDNEGLWLLWRERIRRSHNYMDSDSEDDTGEGSALLPSRERLQDDNYDEEFEGEINDEDEALAEATRQSKSELRYTWWLRVWDLATCGLGRSCFDDHM